MNYKTKKVLYGIALVLILPILYFSSFNLEFKKSDLEIIDSILIKEPKFSGSRSIVLHVKGYDNKFTTDDFSYHVLKKDKFKSEVNIGDKVHIGIKNNESMSWVDKINKEFKILKIMELRTDMETYISIEDYNRYRKKDFNLTYVFYSIGLVIYIIWIRKNNQL